MSFCCHKHSPQKLTLYYHLMKPKRGALIHVLQQSTKHMRLITLRGYIKVCELKQKYKHVKAMPLPHFNHTLKCHG